MGRAWDDYCNAPPRIHLNVAALPFLAVRGRTPYPVVTLTASSCCIRRTIFSRLRAVSLAFLWLFILSLTRFAVVWQLCPAQVFKAGAQALQVSHAAFVW